MSQFKPGTPPGPFAKLGLTSVFASLVWALVSLPGTNPATAGEDRPVIEESIIMLYYRELTAAATFYGDTLGLEPVFRSDSALLYRLTPNSVIGLIREGDGAYHRVQERNAVMVSIVTPDVDAWYERLGTRDDVSILKPIANSSNNPIRAFLVEDPGGYTVEFFTWLSPPS